MVKIYPCVVNEHADLYKLYKQKKYKPYTQKQLTDLIVKIKKITPPWVRIARLIRDIPEESIVAGNKTTNLRQLIALTASKDGWSCKCIRCREVGRSHNMEHGTLNAKLVSRKYQANGGTEYFLSYESPDKKILYAFLRLRIKPPLTPPFVKGEKNFLTSIQQGNDSSPLRKGRLGGVYLPELNGAALIRELHTYGQATEIGSKGKVQHLGLGQRLLSEAEKITQQNNLNKIAVISGIGVRSYYKKFGYKLEGTYMVKNLTKKTK
jgi:elongator complex protein 3